MVPAKCPSRVCSSAQCPTTKGGGGVCEFDRHPRELEAAHLQQAARADPGLPGHVREAGKQRAPRAAGDQGRHAVGGTGTARGPRAGGHGTFPLRRAGLAGPKHFLAAPCSSAVWDTALPERGEQFIHRPWLANW